MDAITILKNKLYETQAAMSDCVTDDGYVRSDKRYYYQNLCRMAREFHDAIKALNHLKGA